MKNDKSSLAILSGASPRTEIRDQDVGAPLGKTKFEALEHMLDESNRKPVLYDKLMPTRIQKILLVSSLYDSYTFVEDGRLNDLIFSEYLDLNLRYAPRFDRVSNGRKAIEKLQKGQYDFVISMLRVGDMSIQDFGRKVMQIAPGLPVMVLAFNNRELSIIEEMEELPGIDKVFLWNGDAKLFLGMIKYLEDRMNAWHDARLAGIQVLILIEDSIRFYSAYLPMLYTEIMQQTQLLMSDGLNQMQKLLRQHARPKILLATNYEEGLRYYRKYQDHLLGIITDAAFPRKGRHDSHAGIDFARMVKEESPDRPVLIQSSDSSNKVFANQIDASFINKRSASLLHDVREFMQSQLGFGDFVFRRPDGSMVTTAKDLRSLEEALQLIPEESLVYHGQRKDFSTWLMARTEFDLATMIRRKKMIEFETPSDFREHLITSLKRHRSRSRAGIVSDFSGGTFEGVSGFVRIGTGSLGGKGRGLAFFNSLLEDYHIDIEIPGTRIFVPPTAVLATDVFDSFVESNNLTPFVLEETDDDRIDRSVLEARLPQDVIEQLRIFLSRVRYPLAVRSSSLLEDASYQPFAGVYSTFMLPNNNPSLETRVTELCNAIKLVFASTFYDHAKSYIAQTPNRVEEEKMAVVIQQMVGRRRSGYLYPDVAGVARSHNFYPLGGMRAEDGVIVPALGLGRTVVEGGRCLRFSPNNPQGLYNLLTPRDYVNNAQREFFALDLSRPGPNWNKREATRTNVVPLDLDVAAEHGSFERVGQIYSRQTNSIEDFAPGVPGLKLVTMKGLFSDPSLPLADALSFLLSVGKHGLSCPVELEFAANIRTSKERPLELALLQLRPMVIETGDSDVDETALNREDAICLSSEAIGHGTFQGVYDIVYVRDDNFSRAMTREIADQIGSLNASLREAGRPYLLIGPGRWGSTDWRLGVPVVWSQISAVRCIVETELKDLRVAPSQGSHFFQNMTSFGIGYLTLQRHQRASFIDHEWLGAQPAEFSTEYIRHIACSDPLDIAIDSRSGIGAVMKPGRRAPRRSVLLR